MFEPFDMLTFSSSLRSDRALQGLRDRAVELTLTMQDRTEDVGE